MGRSLFDQETQVHASRTYDDSVAPTEAAYETNPLELMADLNNVRSMLNELRSVRNDNWWDALTAPVTFVTDSPTTRGIQDAAEDLWDLERKRLLRRHAMVGIDVAVPAAVKATGTLTSTGTPQDGDQVTIGTTTYTYKAALTPVAYEVLIGVSQATSMENLRRAINDDGVIGTNYAAGTSAHPDVTATDTATTVVATAIKAGTAGNLIVTTDPVDVGGVLAWSGGVLASGAGDVVILGAGELPDETTAAIGAVTTLGTVVAYESTFATASLEEVAGSSDVQPKNLVKIVDGVTRDPITDASGREVMGLLQSESNTDGFTIAVGTPNRVQITFVVINATGDDLEIIDGTDIGGEDIDYAYVERNAFDDLPEQAFLGEDFTDVGAGTADRQAVYDNQGIVPVNVTTNSILDLESSGIFWEIRDDAEVSLFKVTEGSAGGITDITISGDVDTYVNDAKDVDFDQGISVGTGLTRPIDIGETDGVIETTAGNLELQAFAELIFSDANEDVTWSRNGILLSDTAQEWIDFEGEFGEVSLLNAIVQAKQSTERAEAWAALTGNIAKDAGITGAGGGANITTQMPSYKGITFTSSVEVFINGQKQRPGADAAANFDVYPHVTPANQALGDFHAEFALYFRGGVNPDVVNMVVWGQPTP